MQCDWGESSWCALPAMKENGITNRTQGKDTQRGRCNFLLFFFYGWILHASFGFEELRLITKNSLYLLAVRVHSEVGNNQISSFLHRDFWLPVALSEELKCEWDLMEPLALVKVVYSKRTAFVKGTKSCLQPICHLCLHEYADTAVSVKCGKYWKMQIDYWDH